VAGDVAADFGKPFGIGDWNGDGIDDGVWRPGNRRFYLDANGNDTWDAWPGDLVTGIRCRHYSRWRGLNGDG
jgi:hypothetical protein